MAEERLTASLLLQMRSPAMEELLDTPATYALAALCVLISIPGFFALRDEKRRAWFLFSAYDVKRGKNLVGAVVSHFAHGDIGHLLLNMLVLHFFGPDVEEALGLVPFVLLYVASGFVGTLALFVLKHKNRKHSALGASGCIAGVVFAMVVIAPGSEFIVFPVPIPIPAPLFAVLYLIASSLMTGRGDRVAHEAHIGGAVTGLALAGLLYGPGFAPLARAVKELLG